MCRKDAGDKPPRLGLSAADEDAVNSQPTLPHHLPNVVRDAGRFGEPSVVPHAWSDRLASLTASSILRKVSPRLGGLPTAGEGRIQSCSQVEGPHSLPVQRAVYSCAK